VLIIGASKRLGAVRKLEGNTQANQRDDQSREHSCFNMIKLKGEREPKELVALAVRQTIKFMNVNIHISVLYKVKGESQRNWSRWQYGRGNPRPTLGQVAGRRPTPVRRVRKPLADRPHAGNQPANIRLINRRNDARRDQFPWLSPGGCLPNPAKTSENTKPKAPGHRQAGRAVLGRGRSKNRPRPKTHAKKLAAGA